MNTFRHPPIVLQMFNLVVATLCLSALAEEKGQQSRDDALGGVRSTEPKQQETLTVFHAGQEVLCLSEPGWDH